MNAFTIAFAYMRLRPLHMTLNIILLSLGIAAISLLMLFAHQLENRMMRNAAGIDMVVGAKGSPIQLILSSLYHLDVPTGNIPLAEAESLAADPRVKSVMPLALGDSFRGFRIVGTSHSYVAHYGGDILAGTLWDVTMEVTLGAVAARDLGLVVGDQFIPNHGLANAASNHSDHRYRIVGVLKPTGTVVDRLILTSVESVWVVHGYNPINAMQIENRADEHNTVEDHEGSEEKETTYEITALLVKFRSPIALVSLPRFINARTSMQAALPGYEISRLMKLVGFGVDGFRAFAGVLVVSAGLGIFTTLYNALSERRYDIAVFRALGASQGRVLWQFLLEGALLSLVGAVLGLVIGHSIAELTGIWLWREHQLNFSGMIWLAGEFWLLGLAFTIGLVAGLLPAIQAYRLDVSGVLAKG